MNLKTKQKKHLSSMQFSHLFPISNFFFCLKKLYNIKKHTKKKPLIFYYTRHLGSTLTWYKATLHRQTASFFNTALSSRGTLRNSEQKIITQDSSLNPPYSWMVQYQHDRNTELIQSKTALLTGQRGLWLHFVQQYFKVQGRTRPRIYPFCNAFPNIFIF